MLDDEIIKSHLGRFTAADCTRLWQHSIYADMHPELLALMKRFELCYELRDSNPTTWLAPQLLPPAKAAALANWTHPDDLVLRYRYAFLPKGHINRLTVRQHRFVLKPELGWVNGVLFERDATSVLVELLPNGSEIELRARGPQHNELLAVIAADLDALNDSFPGLRDKVDKRIPCHCKRCIAESIPHFFEQRALLQRKKDHRLKVECPLSYEDVSVIELLDGLRLDHLPTWAKEDQTVRIFLASSAELISDRDAFELYVLQQNQHFRKKGIYFEIVRWENFLDAMSPTRLQDEYNKKIETCDIVVSLFFTKTGKYTEEEFDYAYNHFKTTGKPQIYTYFKDAQITTGSIRRQDVISLLDFKEKLEKLGHFPTSYADAENLKRHFRDQLDKLFP